MQSGSLTQQEIIQFRLLKKMAVILLLMFRLDRPVGPSEVSEILEIDRHTASKYLKSAVDIGIATRPHYHDGYLLTNQGRQLVLGVDNPVDKLDNSDHNMKAMVKKAPVTGEILTSGPTTTTDINNNKGLTAVAVDDDWRENPQFEANIKALKLCGVGEPSRSRLAGMPHVTPEYITAHAAAAKRDKKNIGMLIHRIRSEDPTPDDSVDKYTSGEFSDFIDH